jgi:electron transfer flavoprotein beta subunit
LVRRLDGGRREQLVVDAPCVISVEGSVAELRRASLGATLAAREVAVEVVPVPGLHGHPSPVTRPWSPPARVQPAPAGDVALQRVVELTGALVERTPPRTVELSADDAADLILEQLRTWGYLESSE